MAEHTRSLSMAQPFKLLLSSRLWILLLPLFLVSGWCPVARGHGRLIEPPSRSSMWRQGFQNPPDYNDHELYCGGFTRQWVRNDGKCGVCGDPWDMPEPRPHEAGGMYANGIIVRKYRKNSSIKIVVELTANHRGFFEFRMCPNNNVKKKTSQSCLDRYVLRRTDGQGTRYYPGEGNKPFVARFNLPRDVLCNQCVFQWRYVAGNNWGKCPNGTEAVGCGPQEEFRACADVAIVGQGPVTTFKEEEGTEDEENVANEIPQSPVEPDVDGERKNEVISSSEQEWERRRQESRQSSVAGRVVALLCAFLLTSVILFLVLWYFIAGKEKLKRSSWGRKVLKRSKSGAPPATKTNFAPSNGKGKRFLTFFIPQDGSIFQNIFSSKASGRPRFTPPHVSSPIGPPTVIASINGVSSQHPPRGIMKKPPNIPPPPPPVPSAPSPSTSSSSPPAYSSIYGPGLQRPSQPPPPPPVPPPRVGGGGRRQPPVTEGYAGVTVNGVALPSMDGANGVFGLSTDV